MKSIFRNQIILFTILLGSASSYASDALVGIAEIRGLQHLSDSVVQIAERWDIDLEADTLSDSLEEALSLESLEGLDPAGLIRMALFMSSDTMTPQFQVTLPLLEGSDHLMQALQKNWNESDVGVPLGMRRFTPSDDDPTGLTVPELFTQIRGNDLIIASHTNAMGDLPDALSGVDGAVAITILPDHIADLITPMMEMQAQSMRQMMEDMTEEERAELNIDAMMAGQQMVLAVLRQFKGISLGLGTDQGVLALQTRVEAMPGTILSEIVSSMAPPSAAYLQLPPADALWAAAGRLTIPDTLPEAYFRLAKSMISMAPAEFDMAPLIESGMNLMRDQYASDYAYAVLPSSEAASGVNLMQAWRIKDPARMKAALEDYIHVSHTLMQQQNPDTAADILTWDEPRTYRDHEVNGYSMNSAMGDPEVEEALRATIPFFLQLNIHYVFVNDMMITSMGSEADMNAIIDRALDGGGLSLADAPAIRTHFPDLPDSFVDISLVKPIALMRMFSALAPVIPADWVETLDSDWATMASYSVASGNTVDSYLRVDLVGLMELIQSIEEATDGMNGEEMDGTDEMDYE